MFWHKKQIQIWKTFGGGVFHDSGRISIHQLFYTKDTAPYGDMSNVRWLALDQNTNLENKNIDCRLFSEDANLISKVYVY